MTLSHSLNMTFCEACDKHVKYFKAHCKTALHTRNILNMISPLRPEKYTTCNICDKRVKKKGLKIHQKTNLHLSKLITTTVSDGAFKGHIKIRVFNFHPPGPSSIVEAVDLVKPVVIKFINLTLSEINPIKFYMGIKLELTKDEGTTSSYSRTDPYFITSLEDFKRSNVYNDLIKQEQEIDNTIVGSGFNISKILFIDIHVLKSDPLRASSYINLPTVIQNKKAVINIKNKDNKCFLWSILAHLYPATDHVERVSKYTQYQDTLNVKDLTFPMALTDIPKFEKMNNLSVNVYGLTETNKVQVLKITNDKKTTHVNLLYFNSEENSHYTYIKDLSRLIKSQLCQRKNKVFTCSRCLNFFNSQTKLDTHEEYCCEHTAAVVKMPKDGTKISFNDEKKMIKHPFVIYVDFESILEKIETVLPNPEESYTNKYQKHTPCGFCYYIKSSVGNEYNKLEEYRGSNTPEEFVKRLEKDCVRLTKIMRETNKPMSLTSEEKREFRKNNACHICEKKIGKELKVRDHCHLTGKYRGPAHQSCNINYKLPSFIPVFLHNNANYDTHLFIKELSKTSGSITAIPNTDQKYISFTKRIHTSPITQIRFLDTFKFMASPLVNLVQNLKEFPCLSEYFSDKDLLTQKGIYPYDYMDSFERFNETQIPSKENFYNKLNNSHIPDKDYEHAQNVWKKYNIKNLGEYHDLYLKTDVLLLADVFEAFRTICHSGYGLDPAHYYTAPGLAWSAMLKMTKQDLDLITDVDMLLMIEKSKRGGISQVCSKRYTKVNNKYLPNYDSTKESSYLMYYDSNNLYGWAMSQALPYGKLRWVMEKDYKKVLQDVCISTQKELDD